MALREEALAAELVAVVCVVMESRWLSRFGLTRPIDSRPFAVIGSCSALLYIPYGVLSLCTGRFFEPGNFGSDPQARCLDGEMDIAREVNHTVQVRMDTKIGFRP